MNKLAALGLVAVLSLAGLTACDGKKDCPQADGISADTTQSLVVPEKGGGGHGSSGGGHASGGSAGEGGSAGHSSGESSTSGKSGTGADEGTTGGSGVVPGTGAHPVSGSSDCKQ